MDKFLCHDFLGPARLPPISRIRHSFRQHGKKHFKNHWQRTICILIATFLPLLYGCVPTQKAPPPPPAPVSPPPPPPPQLSMIRTYGNTVYGGCIGSNIVPHDKEERDRYIKAKRNNNTFCVRLFYATDRKREKYLAAGPVKYSNDRSEKNIIYGTVDVLVADSRRRDPGSTDNMSVSFSSSVEMNDVAFIRAVSKRLSEENNSRKALIFVHGYNNSFDDAAIRTAQIYYDVEKYGTKFVPIFYSWASQDRAIGYTIDETNSEWSQRNFYIFLKNFLEETDADEVYLMAHSMGNRILTKALVDISEDRPSLTQKIKHIFLAAPDIDTMTFKRDIGGVLASMTEGKVSLYVSSRDKALLASKDLHGSPRTGWFTPGSELVVIKGIETIDSSLIDLSFIGHDYAMSTCTVLQDIEYWMSGRGGERLWLEQKMQQETPYYFFKNDHFKDCKMPTYSPDLQVVDRKKYNLEVSKKKKPVM